jgi:aminopeptidase N
MTMKTETPVAIRLSDYRAPSYRIVSTALAFDLDPDLTIVRAALVFEAQGAPEPLQLDGEDLALLSIKMDGVALDPSLYELNGRGLLLKAPPERFTLETEVQFSPRANTSLSGLYLSDGLLCTQCEAEGFRRITFYLDRPDTMAVFTTRIEANAGQFPVLLSNGNLIDSGTLPGGRHFAVWSDPFKKPSYLFALVAGQLGRIEDSFTTMSGRKVALQVFVDPGNEARAAYAMDALKRSMAWDEQAYGREYDLDIFMIVAVGAFNFGAMENKGLNIFNDRYVLADPATATDLDFELIESIVAHEYFHNWTGNRITCRDWFQLCLKEGFTVFRDQQFSGDARSVATQRIADVKQLRLRQFPEDAGPLAHPVRPEAYIEIDNFYTATVYEKGAEIIRMLRTLLGPEGFRKATDLYFSRHDGEATTIEAFAKVFEDATGRDLSQFKLWWHQAGTPELTVATHHDEAAQTFDVTISQSVPPTPGETAKRPMHIPFAIGLNGPDGADLPLQLDGENEAKGTTRVLELTQATQSWRFVNVTKRPVLSAARGFSAPVKIRSDLTPDDLIHLMGRDTDLFNRWEAGQQMATAHLLRAAAGGAAQDAKLVAAFGHVLADWRRDPAFAALALTLPADSDLIQATPEGAADPESIHAARLGLTHAIAAAHRDGFARVFEDAAPQGSFAPTAEQAGQRAVRNAALRYLCAGDPDGGAARAFAAFEAAANMTDTMAALAILSHLDAPERGAALDIFAARWASNPLVMDKWMSVQAMSSRTAAADDAIRLTEHPHFTLTNPNRFRSLVASFALNNARGFHRPDGAGYRFAADQALAMDKVNPQVSARVFGAFESKKRFTPALQALMQAEIQRVSAAQGISKNLFEMASRCAV